MKIIQETFKGSDGVTEYLLGFHVEKNGWQIYPSDINQVCMKKEYCEQFIAAVNNGRY